MHSPSREGFPFCTRAKSSVRSGFPACKVTRTNRWPLRELPRWGSDFDARFQPPHIPIMAILKIARMGHPVLAGVAAPVPDPTAPDIKRLVEDMIETMEDANGAGLAAPQVHVPLRVVVFQAPLSRSEDSLPEAEAFDHTAPLTVLINPVVEVLDPLVEGGWEGCLSVPGMRGWVERPRQIRYMGYDTQGRRILRIAKGFHARVVQHECDHIDGMVYPQRMTDLTRLIFESELQHWLDKRDDRRAAQ